MKERHPWHYLTAYEAFRPLQAGIEDLNLGPCTCNTCAQPGVPLVSSQLCLCVISYNMPKSIDQVYSLSIAVKLSLFKSRLSVEVTVIPLATEKAWF